MQIIQVYKKLQSIEQQVGQIRKDLASRFASSLPKRNVNESNIFKLIDRETRSSYSEQNGS